MHRPNREALAEQLLEGISSGRWAPGVRLPPERALAEEFGLSRPIVREVLRGLQEQGLVEIVAGRGAFVRELSSVDGARSLDSYFRRRNPTAREVMEARLMLETQTARLAASLATGADVAALERCVADYDAAENIIDRARHDIAFHGVLARSGRNAVVETMFASIVSLTFELMLRSHSDPQVAHAGGPLHRQILDAVRAGDPDAAEQAMREHLGLAQHMYGKDFDQGVDTVARREMRQFLGSLTWFEEVLDEVTRRFQATATTTSMSDEPGAS